MSELLFFTLGIMLGGLTGVVCMCMLQINRVNQMEIRYRKLLDKLNGGSNV